MKRTSTLLFCLGTFLSLPTLTPAGPVPGPNVPSSSSIAALRSKYIRPDAVPVPSDNAITEDRVLLGKTLFFDPRLSGSNFISCATCHNPGFAWGDGLPKGIGHGMKQLGRRTPTILNTAFGDLMFWDGRADSLEAQALGPIQSPGEMNMPLGDVVAKINSISGYKPLFERAYPGEPINEKTIAKAIATFERTVITPEAPFDAWVAGNDGAISQSAKRGFEVFNGKARCAECHSGWNFTDSGFHDIGIADDDLGRGKPLKLEAMQHAFKTPTLRNATLRAPFLHNGSEPTLEAVIDFCDRGGRAQRVSLSPEVQPLHLSEQEKKDLVEFIGTLTSSKQ